MVFEQAKDYLDEYIRYRERFEERIREKFPAIHALRSAGTEALKAVRGFLEPPGNNQPHRSAAKRASHA